MHDCRFELLNALITKETMKRYHVRVGVTGNVRFYCFLFKRGDEHVEDGLFDCGLFACDVPSAAPAVSFGCSCRHTHRIRMVNRVGKKMG